MIYEHCIVVLNLDRQTGIGLVPVIISTVYVVGFYVVELSSMELYLAYLYQFLACPCHEHRDTKLMLLFNY